MALQLLARAARAARPPVSGSVRPAHAGPGDDGPVCRPPPCGASAARPPPAPVRIACTPPPPTGQPPPCPPAATSRTLACEDAMTTSDGRISRRTSAAASAEGRCGLELDAVTRRLAAAERARRDHYEREAARADPAPRAPPADFARYCLSAATRADVPPVCPADTEHCRIHRHKYADPCAPYPRREVHLDRGSGTSEGSKGFAARIMEKLKRANSAAERPESCGPRPAPPRSHDH